MHIRRSTVLTLSAASVLAVGAFGPIASATTVPGTGGEEGGGGGDCVVGVSWNNFQEERWAKWDEPAMQSQRSRPVVAATSRPTHSPRPRRRRATSRTSSPRAPTSS